MKFRISVVIARWKRGFDSVNEHVILEKKDIFNKETDDPYGLP